MVAAAERKLQILLLFEAALTFGQTPALASSGSATGGYDAESHISSIPAARLLSPQILTVSLRYRAPTERFPNGPPQRKRYGEASAFLRPSLFMLRWIFHFRSSKKWWKNLNSGTSLCL